MPNTFKDYLQEIFTETHPMILDDDGPDAFNNYEWDTEELIKWGEFYGKKQFLAGQQDILNTIKK